MFDKDGNLSIILMGILYFVLGVVFIAATEELLKTFNYILVCICAIIGVVQIIMFLMGRRYKENNYTEMLVGVVFIWVSLILYVYYGFMINILPILFSLYLFVMAVEFIFRYVQYRDAEGFQRNKYLVLSLVAIVVGLLLIFNPGSVIFTYLKITGMFLIGVAFLYFFEYGKKTWNK